MPKKFIYNRYQPEILDAVFKRQSDPQRQEPEQGEKEQKAPFFVLLDDVISDQRLKYDENLMELFVAGVTTRSSRSHHTVRKGDHTDDSRPLTSSLS